MIDDLKKAYSSYQQALYYMPNPQVRLARLKATVFPPSPASGPAADAFLLLTFSFSTLLQEPKLWYGIGILYDRYGSLEHAEEAFSSVIRMDPSESSTLPRSLLFALREDHPTEPSSVAPLRFPVCLADFEKANEIFFRLGIIYKQQRKSAQSLEVRLRSRRTWPAPERRRTDAPLSLPQCFRYILQNPPRPLTEIDIWFQIGHVYEQQKDVSRLPRLLSSAESSLFPFTVPRRQGVV